MVVLEVEDMKNNECDGDLQFLARGACGGGSTAPEDDSPPAPISPSSPNSSPELLLSCRPVGVR